MNCKIIFLELAIFSNLRVIKSSLIQSNTVEGKKEFLKKLCFTLKRGILFTFLVLQVLFKERIILNKYFGYWLLKILYS